MKFITGNSTRKKRAALLVGLFALFAGAWLGVNLMLADAAGNFIGPSCASGGNCSGAIVTDSAYNLAIGAGATDSATKLFIVASDTTQAGWAMRIVQPGTSFPLFVVRNDQRIGIASAVTSTASYKLTIGGDTWLGGNLLVTGSLTASGLSGTISAQNVTPGVFNSGSGNFAFGAGLGIATTTNVSLPQPLSVYGGGYFSGNVGIGATAPSRSLHIQQSESVIYLNTTATAAGNHAMLILETQGTGDNKPQIRFSNVGTANWSIGADPTDSQKFKFSNNQNIGTNDRLVITTGGNVGIGTTGPAYKLDVTDAAPSIRVGKTDQSGGNLYFGNSSHGIQRGTPNTNFINIFTAGGTESGFAFTHGTAGQVMTILNTGAVGIGTTNPTSTLTVTGEIKSTSGGIRFPDGTLQNTSAQSASIPASNVTAGTFATGNFAYQASLGIATTTNVGLPQPLSVYGGGYFSGSVGIGTSGPGQKLHVSGGVALFNNTAVGSGADAQSGLRIVAPISTTHYNWMIGAQQNVNAGFEITPSTAVGGTTFSTPAVTILQSGNVGIGTASPGYKLDVTGTAHITGAVTLDTDLTVPYGGTGVSALTGVLKGNGASAFSAMNGTANYAARWTDANTIGTGVLYDNGTNVGVGTSSPAYKLDVAGDVNAQNLRINGTAITGSQWVTNSSNIYYNTGNVGIGAASPGSKLVIDGIDNYTNGITIQNTASYQNLITAFSDGINPTTGSALQFKIANNASGGNTAVMTLKGSGNVGIGTTGPSYKLHVEGGDIYVNNGGGGILRLGSGGSYISRNNSLFQFNADSVPYVFKQGESEKVRIDTNGNVGIGTTGPNYKLDVNGAIGTNLNSIMFQPSGGSVATDGTYGIYWHNSGGTTPSADYGIYRTSGAWTASTYQQLKLNFATGIQLGAGTGVGAGYDKSYVEVVSGKGLMVTSGNVGIGTTGPTSKLHVAGDVRINADNAALMLNSSGATTNTHVTFASAGSTTWEFGKRDATNAIYFWNGSSDVFTIQTGGNVGIGTTAPGYPLTVSGTIAIVGTGNGLRFADGTTQLTSAQSASIPASNVTAGTFATGNFSFQSSLGVATTTNANLPANLSVYGTSWHSGTATFLTNVYLANTNTALTQGGGNALKIQTNSGYIDIGAMNTSYAHIYTDRPSVYFDKAVNIGAGNVLFNTSGGNSYVNGGNVGIGTTSPGYKLDVNGNLNFTGTVYGNGKVVAETGDAYLRINQSNSFSSGIWLGSSNLMLSTGRISVGSTGGAGNVDIYGNGDAVLRVNISGSPNVASWFNTGGNFGIGTTGPVAKLDVMGAARVGPHATGRLVYFTGDIGSGQTGDGGFEIRHSNATQGIGFGYNTIYQTGANPNQELNIRAIGSGPITLNAVGGATGAVGIGTTNPTSTLTVVGAIKSTTGGFIFPDGTTQLTSAQSASIPASNVTAGTFATGNFSFRSSLGVGTTTNANLPANLSVYGTSYFTGYVGIGTTGPTYNLDVAGTGRFTGTVAGADPILAGDFVTKGWFNSQGLNAVSCSADSLCEVQALNSTGSITTAGNMTFNASGASLTMTAGTITGVSKLYVTTIDPIYELGGTQFATYGPESVGVMVEKAGKGKLGCDMRHATCDKNGYEYMLDFGGAAKGSDLWTFWHTIAEGQGMANISLVLTPEGDFAKLWYELKPQDKKIVVRGDKPVPFSYRLSAPRHDAAAWSNIPDSRYEHPVILPAKK